MQKYPKNLKNDKNTHALKMLSESGILKIQFRQPPNLGIINLNVEFGATSTLDEKVDMNSKIIDFWTEIKCVS